MNSEKSEKAKRYAYNLLRIRPRSENELTVRLKKKGFGETTVGETVSFFKKNGLINDLEFAEAWVDSRLRTAPKGKAALMKELTEKGISANVINRVLSEKIDDESDIAENLAAKKIKDLKGMPKIKMKKKLFDYLAQRGFGGDTIENIMDSLTLKGFFDE